MDISVAIIGAGASGTITAIQLLRKLNCKATIYLIEKREDALFRGAAYSSKLSYDPLNVQAARMSIFNHLPDDFYNWLKLNKQALAETEITKESFVSRKWFGDYLTYNLQVAEQAATTKNIELKIINKACYAINFTQATNRYSLQLDANSQLEIDYLILATGNESPNDILLPSEVSLLGSRYVSNPWLRNPFETIKPTDSVLILGTGLTMVDHVISLYKQNHTGPIFGFSRNGYLPMPHTKSQDYLFEVTEESKDLHNLFADIRSKIKQAKTKNIDWQNVIDAMRPRLSRMWKLMSIPSKKLFLKRIKIFWEIHRHRMPLASATVLQQLQTNGQLQLLSGNYTSVSLIDNAIQFRYKNKVDASEQLISVNQIINCTGPSADYMKTDNLLFKYMIEKGWMKQDELKIGIETGTRGEIIKPNGVVLQNAFAVGPVRKAIEWESTAIREIRTQAENLAFHITSKTEYNNPIMIELGL